MDPYAHQEDHDHLIDLGLSLRALQPQHHPRPRPHSMNWVAAAAQLSDLYQKGEECEEEAEVVQSKRRRGYVKVNMDGVIVGRKVCIFEHGYYSGLALQLEDMFGRQCEFGLKLFETESEFSLFYKDGDENWRSVSDIPWKQFVEGVTRLRIARKDEAFVVLHQN
ncbi:auxin-responsive protein IAA32-like [Cucurbita maxima]|uniref:Auxin-responsive protein n=1 Tax=Cucurbita maxima TaxID=3661 RepID=A0A6J1HSU2_CUCMA|nr:auxin-responsive protein IAA32-like [Cucurbita maxima]